jgi:eukaryotic-like serine/threonine-protein kinase
LAEAPITDLSGTTLGEYQIVSRIGKGGMGVVYEGRHPLIGKRVAVKVLTEQASRSADAERFLAEARAVNAIRHRGIVDIFGFGKVPGGSQYFVMELLEGLPFDELIRQRAPVPYADALRWIDEVLDALDAAHHAGVIHRDIKPSNLFLVDTGRGTPYVKLLDFGIAKLVPTRGQTTTPQTNVNAVVGTPDYMAPEQARGQPISGLTDLYALGCVLYELLTGHRIFTGESALEVMFAHVEKTPAPPSKLNHSLHPAIDTLVLKLVAKKPEDRPKDARAARELVHGVLKQLGATASLPYPGAREFKLVRSGNTSKMPGFEPTVRVSALLRNPVIPAIVAAAVLLSGALAFLLWPSPPPAPVEAHKPIFPVDVVKPPVTPVVPVEPEAVVDAGVAAVVETVLSPAVTVDAGSAVVKQAGPTPPKKDPLVLRLARLKAQLQERDKKMGEPDRILHRLLDQAEKELKVAKTSEQRKAVTAQFDDLQSQLK